MRRSDIEAWGMRESFCTSSSCTIDPEKNQGYPGSFRIQSDDRRPHGCRDCVELGRDALLDFLIKLA